jgi:hypothetical protein
MGELSSVLSIFVLFRTHSSLRLHSPSIHNDFLDTYIALYIITVARLGHGFHIIQVVKYRHWNPVKKKLRDGVLILKLNCVTLFKIHIVDDILKDSHC